MRRAGRSSDRAEESLRSIGRDYTRSEGLQNAAAVIPREVSRKTIGHGKESRARLLFILFSLSAGRWRTACENMVDQVNSIRSSEASAAVCISAKHWVRCWSTRKDVVY